MILILDVDGTLADASHRSHYVDGNVKDWGKFLQPHLVLQDTVIEGAHRGYHHLNRIATKTLFLTGRNEGLRETTTQWLGTHFEVACSPRNLIMRPIGDNRVPTVFKHEALCTIEDSLFWGGFNSETIMAIDDDKFMMKIYRDLGYITLFAPDCWKTMFPDFDHLTDETTWRK